VKVQGKLNRLIIFENVLMLFTKDYQKLSVPVKMIAYLIWHIFI